MNPDRQFRAFGGYLLACSIYQGILYMRPNGTLSAFDPRLGFFILGGLGETGVTLVEWVSAVWLLCLGLALVLGARRIPLLAYLLSEPILALPTGLYIVLSLFGALGHLSAGGRGLMNLVLLFVAFSVLPLALAGYLLEKRRRGLATRPRS